MSDGPARSRPGASPAGRAATSGQGSAPADPRVAGPAGAVPTPTLQVRDLTVRFPTPAGTVRAVDGISYEIGAGEALGLVGESGSGKSVSALALLGLVPPPGRIEAGEVLLAGRSLLGLPPRAWRSVRGREITMVFQDPMTSLNPVLTIGRQVAEPMRHHLGLSRREALGEAVRLLTRVGIPDAPRRLSDHPHQFSGGQRQRITIAMALACGPSVLVADEPTTALDVTVQAEIVALVEELRAELGTAVLWITHDLALVAGLVDRVAVMYAGRLVERAPVGDLYARPLHPYTVGLLASLPATGSPRRAARLPAAGDASGRPFAPVDARGRPGRPRLTAIPGRPPDLRALSPGCAFAPRCPWAEARCREERPPLLDAGSGRASACWRWGEVGGGGS